MGAHRRPARPIGLERPILSVWLSRAAGWPVPEEDPVARAPGRPPEGFTVLP